MKKKILKNRRGQGLIEYLVLVTLVAVGTIGIVRVVGANVSVQFANVAKALGSGDGDQLQAEKIEANMYNKKDLSNFMKGSIGNRAAGGGKNPGTQNVASPMTPPQGGWNFEGGGL